MTEEQLKKLLADQAATIISTVNANMDERFAAQEVKFDNKLDERFAAQKKELKAELSQELKTELGKELKATINTELTTAFGKMHAYFDKRFDALEDKLDKRVGRVADVSDSAVQLAQDNKVEIAAFSHESRRHTKWIQQLRDHTGATLRPNPDNYVEGAAVLND